MPLIKGFTSEYCHAVWYRKTRMVWLPDGEKIVRFDRMYEHDGQTHTCTNRHCMTAKAALDAYHRAKMRKFVAGNGKILEKNHTKLGVTSRM